MPPKSRSTSPDGAAKLLTKPLDDLDAFRSPAAKDRSGKGKDRDDSPPETTEKNPITTYSDDSDELNRYLRTTNKNSYSEADRKRLNKQAEDLSNALKDLPEKPGRTYRGAPGGDWLDKVQKNGLYSDSAFLSSSTSKPAAERFKLISTGGFGGERKDGVMFTIDGRNGRDITDQSSLSHQKEVLFDRGSLFQVKDKYKDGDTTYLHLQELT
jgi:hypothetical protein